MPLTLRIKKLLKKPLRKSSPAESSEPRDAAPETIVAPTPEVGAKHSSQRQPAERHDRLTTESPNEPAATDISPSTSVDDAAQPAVLPRAEPPPEQSDIRAQGGFKRARTSRDLWLEAFEKLPMGIQQELRLGDSDQTPYLQQI